MKNNGITADGLPLCKITFYTKVERGAGNKIAELTLPYDSNSLQSSYKNNVTSSSVVGAESGASQYQKSAPSTLKMTFLLDDSVVETPNQLLQRVMGDNTTETHIKTLLKYGTAVQGKTHVPAFVTITPLNMALNAGADGSFSGMFSELEVKNELVDSKGRRVKAQVSCCLTECLSEKEIKLKSGKSSPDLTHIFQLKAGDKVLVQAAQIYGSAQFVHHVASANNLASVRRAEIGQQITYPPLER